MDHYTIYGDLGSRDVVALTTTLVAKGLPLRLVEQTASLSLPLATRAGEERGPYLRTPEGFVLSGLPRMLEWIERLHPTPPLLPSSPVQRICARLLEDWIELWLPLWPRHSWASVEGLGRHLAAAGFLLGASPTRPDWLLAAWLESDVLVHPHARSHLARHAPRLVSFGSDLLDAHVQPAEALARGGDDDVVPISLLPVLEDLARDYHAYLEENGRALADTGDRVMLDLGLGRRPLPVRPAWEARRIEIAAELALLGPAARRDVSRVLEPVGAWQALGRPPAIPPLDPADPRSL